MLTADAASETPFDVFWRVYPRKVGKQAARKAWAQAIKRERFHIIIARCTQMAADPNLPTDRTLIPHPTTWLNRDGWDDEPYPPPRANGHTRPDPIQQGLALAAHYQAQGE